MSTNPNVQSMTETADRIFEAAHTIVEGMALGTRKQIKELAVAVGSAVNMDPKRVLGFINHFVHETDIAYVTRGKNGGLIRGVRPVKVVKPKRVKKVAAPVVDATNQ
jgi:hypothetical protein